MIIQKWKSWKHIDYGDTDLRSIIEGDKRFNRDEEESYRRLWFQQTGINEGEELVDVEEDAADESDDEELISKRKHSLMR